MENKRIDKYYRNEQDPKDVNWESHFPSSAVIFPSPFNIADIISLEQMRLREVRAELSKLATERRDYGKR